MEEELEGGVWHVLHMRLVSCQMQSGGKHSGDHKNTSDWQNKVEADWTLWSTLLVDKRLLQSISLPFERSQTMKFTQQHKLIGFPHGTGTTCRLWPLIRLLSE